TPTGKRKPIPCPMITCPKSVKVNNVTASSFTVKWKSVRRATGKRLDVSTSKAFTTYVPGYENLDVGNATSYNVIGLSAGTNYYYRLRAYNGNCTSPNSNVISVKTKMHSNQKASAGLGLSKPAPQMVVTVGRLLRSDPQ